MPAKYRFRFNILGRYPARDKAGRPAVTVNLAAGEGEHLVFSGTLTMSEPEWTAFLSALERSLGDAIEVDDHTGESTPADRRKTI